MASFKGWDRAWPWLAWAWSSLAPRPRGSPPENLETWALHHGLITPKLLHLIPGLRKESLARAARTTRLLALLPEIKRAGIPAVAIKGAYLIEKGIYKPDERLMADLDLGVPKRWIPALLTLLRRMGFVGERTPERDGLIVDPSAFPLEGVFREELPWDSPEPHLLLVAVHATRSTRTWGLRLMWLEDTRRLLEISEEGKLWRMARGLGVAKALSGILLWLDMARWGEWPPAPPAPPAPSRLRKLGAGLLAAGPLGFVRRTIEKAGPKL